MKKLLKFLIIILALVLLKTNTVLAKTGVAGPVLGSLSSTYGTRVDPLTGQFRHHDGIDIAAPYGSPVYAMQDGNITFNGVKGGYGNAIMVDSYYADVPQVPRIIILYGHLSMSFVKAGDRVKRGQVIGLVGSTGRSTGPHLHFEVRYKGYSVDPIDYLYKLPAYIDYVAAFRSKNRFVSTNF